MINASRLGEVSRGVGDDAGLKETIPVTRLVAAQRPYFIQTSSLFYLLYSLHSSLIVTRHSSTFSF